MKSAPRNTRLRGSRVNPVVIAAAAALVLLAPVASGSRSLHGSVSRAAAIRLRAKLDAAQVPGGQEFKVPNATGLFTATLTGNTLSWKLTYRGLSAAVLGAHIHIAKPGKSHWEPVIGLCGFLADQGQPAVCHSGVHGTTTVHAGSLYRISAAAVRKAILDGGAYVNLHTPKNYNWGEIRGQIEVVR